MSSSTYWEWISYIKSTDRRTHGVNWTLDAGLLARTCLEALPRLRNGAHTLAVTFHVSLAMRATAYRTSTVGGCLLAGRCATFHVCRGMQMRGVPGEDLAQKGKFGCCIAYCILQAVSFFARALMIISPLLYRGACSILGPLTKLVVLQLYSVSEASVENHSSSLLLCAFRQMVGCTSHALLGL